MKKPNFWTKCKYFFEVSIPRNAVIILLAVLCGLMLVLCIGASGV